MVRGPSAAAFASEALLQIAGDGAPEADRGGVGAVCSC
jgi:hypothetical protein